MATILEKNRVYLKDLNAGDFFLLKEGDVWIKTSTINEAGSHVLCAHCIDTVDYELISYVTAVTQIIIRWEDD